VTTTIAIVLGVLALAAVIGAAIVYRLIYICPPNAVLIFSGPQRTVNGKQVGYRLVQGGRGVRIPLLERVDRMDLTNMIVEIRVNGAYSKGGIPLNVEGVANVKIASGEPTLGNAIERFLGKSRKEIMGVARETLEGNLRGVLATLTPEEVNQDRVKFAEELLDEADIDLKKLGLELDTLKVQNVSDDVGYLDSIGRKQTAELLMRSRVAEAENKASAAERSADNHRNAEIARINAAIAEARADSERRILEAQTRGEAMVAESRGQVEAQVAKAEAELAVQTARVEQVRLQLEADRVAPARARKAELIANARGKAAKVAEEGKATAESLRHMARTWEEAGDSARQIVVAQKLGGLVSQLMATVGSTPIDKVTFIDRDLSGGDGNLAAKAAVTSEQLKHALGVDVPALLNRIATPRAAAEVDGREPAARSKVEWLPSEAMVELE